jgi:hypothetical protein
MTSRIVQISSCLLLLSLTGCEIENAAPPAPAGKVLPGPGTQQAGAVPPGQAPPPAGGFAAPQNNPQAPPAVAGAAVTFAIRLSAGTALPQTGPEGTLMSFSVDYQAAGYQPPSGARCVLVVERGDRKRVEQPAEIAASGTWAVFVQGWPPESGPFQAHVEEITEAGSRRTVSATVPLQ